MWNYITVIFGEHKYFSSTVVVKDCKICTDKISRLKNEKKKEKRQEILHMPLPPLDMLKFSYQFSFIIKKVYVLTLLFYDIVKGNKIWKI